MSQKVDLNYYFNNSTTMGALSLHAVEIIIYGASKRLPAEFKDRWLWPCFGRCILSDREWSNEWQIEALYSFELRNDSVLLSTSAIPSSQHPIEVDSTFKVYTAFFSRIQLPSSVRLNVLGINHARMKVLFHIEWWLFRKNHNIRVLLAIRNGGDVYENVWIVYLFLWKDFLSSTNFKRRGCGTIQFSEREKLDYLKKNFAMESIYSTQTKFHRIWANVHRKCGCIGPFSWCSFWSRIVRYVSCFHTLLTFWFHIFVLE